MPELRNDHGGDGASEVSGCRMAMPELWKQSMGFHLTPAELLETITASGGELRRIGDRLSVKALEPLAPELLICIREHQPALLELLSPGPQPPCDARSETTPDASTEDTPAHTGADGGLHTTSIALCARCGGTHWGPTASPVPEVLPNSQQAMKEVWACLDCATRPEGMPAPPAPESACNIPPGSVVSPCPRCAKPHRLFVAGSPAIPGEPDRNVLICGKCGHTEPACPECKRTNVVIDSQGAYCVDCHKRPGQPKPEPGPRIEPSSLPSRRHHLGEPPPPFVCPECGHRDWREAICHWACRDCQQAQLKPEGTW